MNDRCITCGASVEVVTSGEGTSHYEPLDEARIRADERAKVVREIVAVVRDERYWFDDGLHGWPQAKAEGYAIGFHEAADFVADKFSKGRENA